MAVVTTLHLLLLAACRGGLAGSEAGYVEGCGSRHGVDSDSGRREHLGKVVHNRAYKAKGLMDNSFTHHEYERNGCSTPPSSLPHARVRLWQAKQRKQEPVGDQANTPSCCFLAVAACKLLLDEGS